MLRGTRRLATFQKYSFGSGHVGLELLSPVWLPLGSMQTFATAALAQCVDECVCPR